MEINVTDSKEQQTRKKMGRDGRSKSSQSGLASVKAWDSSLAMTLTRVSSPLSIINGIRLSNATFPYSLSCSCCFFCYRSCTLSLFPFLSVYSSLFFKLHVCKPFHAMPKFSAGLYFCFLFFLQIFSEISYFAGLKI